MKFGEIVTGQAGPKQGSSTTGGRWYTEHPSGRTDLSPGERKDRWTPVGPGRGESTLETGPVFASRYLYLVGIGHRGQGNLGGKVRTMRHILVKYDKKGYRLTQSIGGYSVINHQSLRLSKFIPLWAPLVHTLSPSSSPLKTLLPSTRNRLVGNN